MNNSHAPIAVWRRGDCCSVRLARLRRGKGRCKSCQQSVLRSFMIWIYNLGVVAIFAYATFIREVSMWAWVLAFLLMATSDRELKK